MLDVWIGDVNLTVAVLALCFLVVLPGQLLLCFRVRSPALRLAPGLTALVLLALCLGLRLACPGRQSLLLTFLALYAAMILTVCVLAWVIWGLVRRLRRR